MLLNGHILDRLPEIPSNSVDCIVTSPPYLWMRHYWYQLESEDLRAPATEEIIRRIETVLGVDLGVQFGGGK